MLKLSHKKILLIIIGFILLIGISLIIFSNAIQNNTVYVYNSKQLTSTPTVTPTLTTLPINPRNQSPEIVTEIKQILSEFKSLLLSKYSISTSEVYVIKEEGNIKPETNEVWKLDVNYTSIELPGNEYFQSVLDSHNLIYKPEYDGFATTASSKTYINENIACMIFGGYDPSHDPGNFIQFSCW